VELDLMHRRRPAVAHLFVGHHLGLLQQQLAVEQTRNHHRQTVKTVALLRQAVQRQSADVLLFLQKNWQGLAVAEIALKREQAVAGMFAEMLAWRVSPSAST